MYLFKSNSFFIFSILEQAQLKSGNIVYLELTPDVSNWCLNLSKTGFLSNFSFDSSFGKVVSDDDQIALSAFGNSILLKKLYLEEFCKSKTFINLYFFNLRMRLNK